MVTPRWSLASLDVLCREYRLPASLDREQTWQNALRLVLPRCLPVKLYRQTPGRHRVERGGVVQGAPVGAADLYGWEIRTGRCVQIEAKYGGGRVASAQRRWLDAAGADGCVARVLTYDTAETTLTNLYAAVETVRVALATPSAVRSVWQGGS